MFDLCTNCSFESLCFGEFVKLFAKWWELFISESLVRVNDKMGNMLIKSQNPDASNQAKDLFRNVFFFFM